MKAKKVNTLPSTSQLKNLIKEYDLITIIKKFCEEVSTSMCPRGITFKTFYSTHPIEGFARGVTGRLSKNSLQDGANFSKKFFLPIDNWKQDSNFRQRNECYTIYYQRVCKSISLIGASVTKTFSFTSSPAGLPDGICTF
jgi:hypothetical protein